MSRKFTVPKQKKLHEEKSQVELKEGPQKEKEVKKKNEAKKELAKVDSKSTKRKSDAPLVEPNALAKKAKVEIDKNAPMKPKLGMQFTPFE
jgi:hypothetical protein